MANPTASLLAAAKMLEVTINDDKAELFLKMHLYLLFLKMSEVTNDDKSKCIYFYFSLIQHVGFETDCRRLKAGVERVLKAGKVRFYFPK